MQKLCKTLIDVCFKFKSILEFIFYHHHTQCLLQRDTIQREKKSKKCADAVFVVIEKQMNLIRILMRKVLEGYPMFCLLLDSSGIKKLSYVI